jgi:2-polyprenyl-6-methoxyphenol hydroxylase-like FAD-dependent oxidoreductase
VVAVDPHGAGARMSERVGQAVDVLVVGAGPTGLTLALQAHDHGARVRIVERRAEAFRPSRALIVHPRTLEVLRPLGVTDTLLAGGDPRPRAQLHLGRHVVPVQLAGLDLPDTAFPHLLMVRQAHVEAVLARALACRGVDVERGTALEAFTDEGGRVTAKLRRGGRIERAATQYLVGCDGSASTVRAAASIGWAGHAYRHDVLLADVELDGDLAPGMAHVVAGRQGLVFLFALGELATWRMLATEPATPSGAPFGQLSPPVPRERLQELLDGSGLAAGITDLAWSARIRLQHRIATGYRQGRVFLAGDAAHSHSPAGAQGMNAGIQDASNLGWKLAFADGRIPAQDRDSALLDSYNIERRSVARAVVPLTHAVFWAEAGTDPVATLTRGVLAPLVAPLIPLLLRQRRLVAEGVRVLSQLRWHYRHSPLSVEVPPPSAAGACAGDRLPDQDVIVDGRPRRLHDLTAVPGVHVLLHTDATVPDLPADPLVHVHRVASWPGTGVVAVRPDGHVGYRSGDAAGPGLNEWLAGVGRPPDGRATRPALCRSR